MPATGSNPAAIVQSPARQVAVQAIDAATALCSPTTTTDTSGNYSLSVPSQHDRVHPRAREMIKTGAAPTWNFRSATTRTPMRSTRSTAAAASSGTANSTRNLRAPSGWPARQLHGRARRRAVRDSRYGVSGKAAHSRRRADHRVSGAGAVLERQTTSPTAGLFCPDDGDIGTSSYIVFAAATTWTRTAASRSRDGIYILGDFDGATATPTSSTSQ